MINTASAEQLAEEVEALHEQLKNAVIMMVDDEPIMMEVLQTFLEYEGYNNFLMVSDSTKAVAEVESQWPDILLLDLKMPEVDGFQILEMLRGHPDFYQLPIIILTSSSDAETKLKALEMGATDFLAKPVDASELALRLRNTLTVKAYQDQLTYYDGLTGLPNRSRFTDLLSWTLQTAERDQEPVAAVNLTVDRFKQINDTLGPRVGDLLLKLIADRLSDSVRSSDVVSFTGRNNLWQHIGRLGDDEFCIMLSGGPATNDAAFVAQRLLEVVKQAFIIEDEEVFITASVGIAVFPEDAQDADSLIKHSRTAAKVAQQRGRDVYQFFSSEMNRKALERLQIESDLRRAIERNEFLLHYQPKINTNTGQLAGMEALVRWMHPERGLVPPGMFIDLAEQAGMVSAIGEWVIHEACRQTKIWHESGLEHLNVSVNVSPQQLLDKNLMKTIDAALSSGLDPQHLVVEITESGMVGKEERVIKILNEIKEHGPLLSIDDFGTGYSSLSYLKRLPVDELKIDRSFIIDVPENEQDCAIVKAIVGMADSLKLNLVVEGVEERSQLDYLASIGCHIIQGFYFSRPLPAEEFEAFARQTEVKV
ncbi:MAG: EAL domain-containing protein [Oleiphilaceae bacterium]|nr:EAL domain-containing protein [Oleiphilaceae bacterium]